MEFIPLESKKKVSFLKPSKQIGDFAKKNIEKKKQLKNIKKNVSKKNIKNLEAEKIAAKNAKKSCNNKFKKIKVVKNKRNESNCADKENTTESVSEENNPTSEELTEEKKQEKLKLEKWKRLDEKKKNRLFILRKKKIVSESEIKELHSDIKGVIFPRKKNSRWCWAVFASEEKAAKAFNDLVDNKECYVSKPNPCVKVEMKRKKKMETVKRKLEAKKKLLTIWS